MVRLLLKEINGLLKNHSNNRNITIVGVPSNGTEALIDGLLSSSGIVVADNLPPYAPWVECNSRELFAEPASVSLYTEIGAKSDDEKLSNKYVIDVIFTDNNDISMRIADGVIIVVDSNQSIDFRIQTLIQDSIKGKLKIILFIDNIDTNLLAMDITNLDLIYRDLDEILNGITSLIYQYTSDETYVLNVIQNVAFGCAKEHWAFNLQNFADIYAKSFSRFNKDNLTRKLWSENYYSFQEKKWSNVKKNDTFERSFVRFVLEPIHKVYEVIISNNRSKVENLISKLNIHLEDYQKEQQGKRLLSTFMRKWLPVSNCVLPMCISHFPSPVDAQKYRYDVIYDGTDKTIIESIKNCKESGKFFMYISKTLYTNDQNRRYAFGRIFSGRLRKDDKIKVTTNEGIFERKKVEKIMFVCGRNVDEISEDVCCGRCCAISGLDGFVNRIATLTDYCNKRM